MRNRGGGGYQFTALYFTENNFSSSLVHYCQPVGDDRFRLQIERRYGVRLGQMRRGRPGKDV